MQEHKQLGYLIYFGTLINQALLWSNSNIDYENSQQFQYDIVLVISVFFQFIIGNNIHKNILQNKKFVNILNIKKLHRFSAFIAYFVGKLKIYFFMQYYLNWNIQALKIVFVLYLVFIYMIYMLVLIKYEKNLFINILPQNLKRKSQYEKVKNNLDFYSISHSSQSQSDLDKDFSDLENDSQKNLNWFIFDNKIYSCKNFNHPGGNFILQKIKNKDITKYIFGNTELLFKKNSNLNEYMDIKHKHDFRFFKFIKKNYLGPVNTQQKEYFNTSANSISSELNYQQIPLSILFQESLYQNEFNYKVTEQIDITENYYLYLIQNQNKSQNEKLNFYWVNKLGQYLRLYDKSFNNFFLDCCYCLSPNFLRSKIQNCTKQISQQYKQCQIKLISKLLNFQDSKCLTESKYKIGGGSAQISNEKIYAINGPQGFNNLGFTDQTTRKILLIIQNEEIIKFLDLFEILIQKYLILKNIINPNFHEDYLLSYSNGIKIDLILVSDYQNDLMQYAFFQLNQLLKLQQENKQNKNQVLQQIYVYCRYDLQIYPKIEQLKTEKDKVKIKILESVNEKMNIIWSKDNNRSKKFLQELDLDDQSFSKINFI